MSDLLVGVGIALIAEGLLWALVPDLAAKSLQAIASTPQQQVRTTAWLAVALGLFFVWLVRG